MSEATWEDSGEFTKCYPNFNLEDKVSFNGGSNVMNKGKTVITVTNSYDENGHLAHDPNIQEQGRGMRAKFPNRKYVGDFVK